MAWIIEHKAVLLAAALAVSEVLGSFEFFKASSIFEMVVNALKSLAGK